MVSLIQIENNEPSFFEFGSSVNDLIDRLIPGYLDESRVISAIKEFDFSDEGSKFEIMPSWWLIFHY